MSELALKGTQKFMDKEIPIIYGGFGGGQKVILAKTVSEIHNVRLNDINDLINNNLKEFDIGIDLLDLKNSTDSVGSLLQLGFSNQSIANSIQNWKELEKWTS